MLERPGLAALMLAATAALSATTYTVTSTADSGAGSLRKAIDDANTNPGADTIAFNIVGSGVHTIAPASALPPITGPVVIDGYTQSGALANTNPTSQGLNTVLKIELDGTNAGTNNGLFITGSGSTITGLAINRFQNHGIRIDGSGATGNIIIGNFIGTNAAGTADLGNGPGIQEVATFSVDVAGEEGSVVVSNAHGTVTGAAGGVLLRPFARLISSTGDSVTTYGEPWNMA